LAKLLQGHFIDRITKNDPDPKLCKELPIITIIIAYGKLENGHGRVIVDFT